MDIHRTTAAKVFGVAPDLVSHEMRFAAKRINFGLLYGMGAFSLARDLGVPTSEAKAFIEAYFGQFPRVRGCLDGILAEARAEEGGHDALRPRAADPRDRRFECRACAPTPSAWP